MRLIFTLAMAVLLPAQVFAFNFSEEAGKDAAAKQAKQSSIASMLSEPCRKSIKGQTIALMIAEKQQGLQNVNSSNQGVLFESLYSRLRAIGLNTIPQQSITSRIARAEAEAILNNDPDAAIAASKKLGAGFILRGIISARSGANKMVRANDVNVDIMLTLSDGSGRTISSVRASGQSWAGSDVTGAALSVLDDQADELVARLYSDFCARKAK